MRGILPDNTASLVIRTFTTQTVPWAGPGAVLAGWLVWPGLTENFKEETFGIKTAVPAPVAPAARGGATNTFRSGGKYKYVRNEIGERPTLEED